MSTQIIRRFTSYLAIPAVSAGILGAAAVGLAGIANADTDPTHDGGALASVQECCKAALASVDDAGKLATVAPAPELASVMPQAALASVAPAPELASVMPKAALASVMPRAKLASVTPAPELASVMPKAKTSETRAKVSETRAKASETRASGRKATRA